MELERTFKEVVYTCANPKCKHTQTIRFFADETPLPVTCCVKCRNGFGAEMPQMMMGKGMFPGVATVVAG